MGASFTPPHDIRGNIIFLKGSFALCPRVFPMLSLTSGKTPQKKFVVAKTHKIKM